MRTAKLAVAALCACGSSSTPTPIGTRVGPALSAALGAADTVRAPWRCAAADGPALADETLKAGEHSWQLAGHTMTLAGSGTISIGVVADAGGSAPATLAAIGRVRTQLEDVDLVLALGGMGSTKEELEATLGALAERATWPLVAIPGDLEPAGAHAAAVAALRARALVVIDGRLVRRIDLPGAHVAVVPGASSEKRLVAGDDGCGYAATDVGAMMVDLTSRPGLRILASAEAPRITVDGEPAGMLALTPGALQELDLVLHGPVTEAASAGRTGTRDGAAAPLSPGTLDATTRLPGPRHPASAGVLTISGNAWRWKPIADSK
ncbi:MAG TPA: hypothetical protein VFQ53_13925 [Kofleriaceae bacterium]|nr:hypothetical protein [Kofleriaceae bacterium]